MGLLKFVNIYIKNIFVASFFFRFGGSNSQKIKLSIGYFIMILMIPSFTSVLTTPVFLSHLRPKIMMHHFFYKIYVKVRSHVTIVTFPYS